MSNPHFTIPTTRQGSAWLRATGGLVCLWYSAILAESQQRWLLWDMNATKRDDVEHHHVSKLYPKPKPLPRTSIEDGSA